MAAKFDRFLTVASGIVALMLYTVLIDPPPTVTDEARSRIAGYAVSLAVVAWCRFAWPLTEKKP